MKHIYLAGPFFDDEQIDRLERLEAALEANPTVAGFFSPFRHQYDEYEFGSKEWGEVVFESDRSQLHDADVVVALADFYGDDDVDPGTAWEIGYAGAQKKPVIILKEKQGHLNIMMSVPGHAFVTNAADIADYDFDALPASEWEGKIF